MTIASTSRPDPRETRTRRSALLALAAGLVAPVAARAAQAAHGGEARITIDNFAFKPQKLTIGVGTAVIWENRDDSPHNVVSTAKRFKSPALDTGDSFRFAFDAPGEYDYFCGLHPHMTGTVIVTV